MPEHVFGYGSLTPGDGAGVLCVLHDHRRAWDVAMNNGVTVPGYKYYLDAETGERPVVFVAFLSIRPEPGATVNGVAFPVDPDDLESLDLRERNYDRRDVTAHIEGDVDGRVWAYVGSAAGRRRYERGRAQGRTVVSREYLDGIRADFDARGPGTLDEFDATTDPLEVPVRRLVRRDVGG